MTSAAAQFGGDEVIDRISDVRDEGRGGEVNVGTAAANIAVVNADIGVRAEKLAAMKWSVRLRISWFRWVVLGAAKYLFTFLVFWARF